MIVQTNGKPFIRIEVVGLSPKAEAKCKVMAEGIAYTLSALFWGIENCGIKFEARAGELMLDMAKKTVALGGTLGSEYNLDGE